MLLSKVRFSNKSIDFLFSLFHRDFEAPTALPRASFQPSIHAVEQKLAIVPNVIRFLTVSVTIQAHRHGQSQTPAPVCFQRVFQRIFRAI